MQGQRKIDHYGQDIFIYSCSGILLYIEIDRGVASPRQLKRSNHPEHGYVAWKDVRTSGVERSIIEGVDIHIFVFCVINPFWNVLFLRSVNTNIWIWTPSIIELATPISNRLLLQFVNKKYMNMCFPPDKIIDHTPPLVFVARSLFACTVLSRVLIRIIFTIFGTPAWSKFLSLPCCWSYRAFFFERFWRPPSWPHGDWFRRFTFCQFYYHCFNILPSVTIARLVLRD